MLTEIILGIVALLLLLWILTRKPSGLPPGRWGPPIIGYIPFGKYMDDVLQELHKKFGDIYLWKFGSFVQVFIHDYNIARQVFASPDFIGRPDLVIMRLHYDEALGLSGSNDPLWQINRRFSLHQLRDHGMGKSKLVSAIHTQAQNLLDTLKESSGKAEPITSALHAAILNVIWQMVASKQFEMDDPRHKGFKETMDEAFKVLSPLVMADMFPWVKYIVPSFLRRRVFRLDVLEKLISSYFVYFDEIIEEHRKSLDPDFPRDLMDAYLIEMDEMKKKGENSRLRSEDDLKVLILDMFSAGSDTTDMTMKWLFLYMAANPEVQLKLQKEIDQVLPRGIFASLEDKASMPYTEAVIQEVLRKSSIANVGLHHTATRDTTVAGYKIPKGTMITSAAALIHHDPRYWDRPNEFLPERWLNSEGKFVMKKEGFIAFGTGKRSCPGESLARMELFILTTAVFQNFSISPPEGKSVNLQFDDNNPFNHQPHIQDVVFTIRE